MPSLKSSIKSRMSRQNSKVRVQHVAQDANPSSSTTQSRAKTEAVKSTVTAVRAEDTKTASGVLSDTSQLSQSHSQPHCSPLVTFPLFNINFALPPPTTGPSPSPSPSPTQSHLLSLPHEIFLHLTTFLPFTSLLSLRSTSKAVHTLLSPSQLLRHRHAITARLLQSENQKYAEYRSTHPRLNYSHLWDLFYYAFEWQLQERPSKDLVCYGCLESKPLHCFVERLASRGTGLGGSLAKHRRCKDCMRRYYSLEGQWWREHWFRKAEHRKRRGTAERVGRWIMRGESLVENVERGEEIGVCACCGGIQLELWWGCIACFEQEERRIRKEDGETWGVADADDNGVIPWIYNQSENLRRVWTADKKKRKTKRRERGRLVRRLWRRMMGGGMLRWEGTWEGRVEALVEMALGTNKDDDETAESEQHSTNKQQQDAPESNPEDWSPLTSIPIASDRREARCSMCWIPTCRRRKFLLGLAHQTLRYDRWCGECQREDTQRREKLKWRREVLWHENGEGGGSWDDDDDMGTTMEMLFDDIRRSRTI